MQNPDTLEAEGRDWEWDFTSVSFKNKDQNLSW